MAVHDRRFCDLGKVKGESPESMKYDGRLELTVFIKMYNLILCANYTIYKEGGNRYTGLLSRISRKGRFEMGMEKVSLQVTVRGLEESLIIIA